MSFSLFGKINYTYIYTEIYIIIYNYIYIYTESYKYYTENNLQQQLEQKEVGYITPAMGH